MFALVLTFGPALLLAVLFPGLAFAVAGALLALLLSALVITRAVAHTLNQVATNPAVLLGLALGCGATAFGCAYHARHVYRLPRKR
jgi:fructose-specific phosphotransferase system IIC component